MNIFRQLRWKLSLSYTIVTVSAFLVIFLVMVGMLFIQLFIPENYFSPEQLIDNFRNSNSTLLWGRILSQSPVDKELIRLLVDNPQQNITSYELFSIGALKFWAVTNTTLRVVVLDSDGIILGTYRAGSLENKIGHPIDASQIPGLEAPLKAAMAGETDSRLLYTVLVPNEKYILVYPIFNRASGVEGELLGLGVIFIDAFPTQADVPAHILKIAGRGLILFLLGVGIMGALFGTIFSHGLATRFKRISATTDLWSTGNFSSYIEDTTGDEITQFTQRLNDMAKQLQSLLLRRQDMAVSEERNRLARDLHDSAKQQALAASLELGTVLTLYESDPEGAKKHLVEADALVDAVREELTNLVDELRPHLMDNQDFPENLKDYAFEWSHRNGIDLNFEVEENIELPIEIRETLFRITQEALANVARHSSAHCADIYLQYEADTITLTIKDNGQGFDPTAQHEGLGLRSMSERAAGLGGSFVVESAPGQGTQILITIPTKS